MRTTSLQEISWQHAALRASGCVPSLCMLIQFAQFPALLQVISPATNESGIDETAAEYNVSTALTDEEHRTLWVLLLILISQTGDNVQAQVVDCGTDEDITPTPTTPPTALPTFSSFTSVPAPEPSLITDDVAPAEPEDALDPDLELIIEPTPVIHDAVPDLSRALNSRMPPSQGQSQYPSHLLLLLLSLVKILLT